ncbi:MAG: branched-chain-amino-acid transaminase [Bacillota bacterium]|nr:branched-chain-amino-acid transaminase [Bacillota bacterium]
MPGFEHAYLNGQVLPYQQAMVHVQSPAVKYGAGVFEGLRAYWNAANQVLNVLLIDEHSARLGQSARLLRFEDRFGFDQIRAAVLDLLRVIRPQQDVHIRQTIYLDGDGAMDANGPVSMSVIAVPSSRPKGFDAGIACQISSWTRINDNTLPPRIKCTANYMNGRLALLQAKQDGYDNALLLNSNGFVAEAPGACLFLIKDGVPVTPGVTSDILESITRRKMIELLSEYLGLRTVEREVHRTELYSANEVFLCGTAAEVTPISSIDRLSVSAGKPGPVTRELQRLLLGIARGESDDHPEWRTLV